MGKCIDCAYSDRPIYEYPCDVCRPTKNGRSMYCPEEDERKTDYVSRKWLLDEYDKRHKGPPGGARKMIEEAPAADVRPVIPAQWIALDIYRSEGNYKCSNCGQPCYVPECMGEPMYSVCPNCGAMMGGTP